MRQTCRMPLFFDLLKDLLICLGSVHLTIIHSYKHAIALNDNVKKEKQNVFKVYLLCHTVYFQVYRFEKHRKGCYLNLSQGITFPFEIGFSTTSQRRYSKRDENYLNLSWMKH